MPGNSLSIKRYLSLLLPFHLLFSFSSQISLFFVLPSFRTFLILSSLPSTLPLFMCSHLPSHVPLSVYPFLSSFVSSPPSFLPDLLSSSFLLSLPSFASLASLPFHPYHSPSPSLAPKSITHSMKEASSATVAQPRLLPSPLPRSLLPSSRPCACVLIPPRCACASIHHFRAGKRLNLGCTHGLLGGPAAREKQFIYIFGNFFLIVT